jgi:hypothetical protein
LWIKRKKNLFFLFCFQPKKIWNAHDTAWPSRRMWRKQNCPYIFKKSSLIVDQGFPLFFTLTLLVFFFFLPLNSVMWICQVTIFLKKKKKQVFSI